MENTYLDSFPAHPDMLNSQNLEETAASGVPSVVAPAMAFAAVQILFDGILTCPCMLQWQQELTSHIQSGLSIKVSSGTWSLSLCRVGDVFS